MFTIKVISRLREDDSWYEDKHIIDCDYVDVRSGYAYTVVVGYMNDGSIAVTATITQEVLVADSEMVNGQTQTTHVIIENSKGRTTEVIKAPRVFDTPQPAN